MSAPGIRRQAAFFLYVLLLLRLIFAALVPITGDEAYHVEWARRLDWCYYDHPGMVAWLMYPFIRMFGESLLSVRFQAVCTGMFLCGAAYALGRRMNPGTGVARRALFIAGAVPLAAGLSLLVSTDTPLAAFWTGALFCLYRACRTDRTRWWIGTGVCLGGAMLSKFIAFGFFPAMFFYLAASPRTRSLLRRPGPWLAAAAALVIFLPVVVWNARHGWLTFSFNFVRRQGSLFFSPRSFLAYAAGQLLLFSPFVCLVPLWRLCRSPRELLADPDDLFLLTFAGVPLGGFACISLLRPVGAHWTSVALVPLAVLCARLLEGRGKKLRRWTAGTAAGSSLLLYLFIGGVLAAGPGRWYRALRRVGVPPAEAEWYTAAVFGNRGMALAAEAFRARYGGFCATNSYALSSVLTFYSPAKTHYLVWGSGSVYGRNYDLWDAFPAYRGRTGVLVLFRKRLTMELAGKVKRHFEEITVCGFRGMVSPNEKKTWIGDGGGKKVCFVEYTAPVEYRAFVLIVGKRFSGDPSG